MFFLNWSISISSCLERLCCAEVAEGLDTDIWKRGVVAVGVNAAALVVVVTNCSSITHAH